MFIDLREREGRERETLMGERNIDELPSISTLARNQTCSLKCMGGGSNQLSHRARAKQITERKHVTQAKDCSISQMFGPQS